MIIVKLKKDAFVIPFHQGTEYVLIQELNNGLVLKPKYTKDYDKQLIRIFWVEEHGAATS